MTMLSEGSNMDMFNEGFRGQQLLPKQGFNRQQLLPIQTMPFNNVDKYSAEPNRTGLVATSQAVPRLNRKRCL